MSTFYTGALEPKAFDIYTQVIVGSFQRFLPPLENNSCLFHVEISMQMTLSFT
jgi:hypothetical protein